MSIDLHVLLVRPIYASNIGMTARAMANMGAKKLILIEPKAQINSKAKQGAAGAQDMLQNLETFDSWQSYLEKYDGRLRLAMTKRGGTRRKLEPLKDTLKSEGSGQGIDLVFGPEDDGLSLSDVEWCHRCCYLPTFGEFKSLNLAQAVLLSLYILVDQVAPPPLAEGLPENSDNTESLSQEIDHWLHQRLKVTGFDLDSKKVNAHLTLKSMIFRAVPTQKEAKTFVSALAQTVRKLSE